MEYSLKDYRHKSGTIQPFSSSPLTTQAPCIIVIKNQNTAFVFEPVETNTSEVIYIETLYEPRCVRTPKDNSKYMDVGARRFLSEHGFEIVN
jgi:hypothetical protein